MAARRSAGCGATRWRSLFGLLFVLLVAVWLAAPIWAEHVARPARTRTTSTDTIVIDGKETDVVSADGVPIGPHVEGGVLPRAPTRTAAT